MAEQLHGKLGQVLANTAAAKLFSLSGLFAVYKPKGPTSASVLNQLKEKLLAEAGIQTCARKRKKQILKIGHGGTLDSAAAGVLVVGIGQGTKMLSNILAGSKKYTAIGELGKATDTLDATGKVTEEKPYGIGAYLHQVFHPELHCQCWLHPSALLTQERLVSEAERVVMIYSRIDEARRSWITKGDLERVLQKFTGDIMQVPPLYSALKRDGQRLSSLMKKGEAVEAKPARPVTVYSLSLQNFQPPLFTLDVECGGGFYVRSLVSDIGKELSSCANVQELTRTKQGPFTLEEHALHEDKWTIDEIAQSLEHCMSLLAIEPSFKKLKTEHSEESIVSCEDK